MRIKDIEQEKQIVIKEIEKQLEILKPEKGLKNIEMFKERMQWALNNLEPKLHYSIGNAKLPKTTLIFNLGTWFNCPGRKGGFCEICEKCYDKSPEVRFKDRLKERIEQEIYFRAIPAHVIGMQLAKIIKEYNTPRRIYKIDRIRFSEVGELRNQNDLEKITLISNIVESLTNVKSYTYTHNKNLNFDIYRPSLTINGSNFMVDNEYRVVKDREEEFNNLYDLANKKDCICDCVKCNNYCLEKTQSIIVEELR